MVADAVLLIEDMLNADAILIGAPVYFAGPNGALCALLIALFMQPPITDSFWLGNLLPPLQPVGVQVQHHPLTASTSILCSLRCLL